MNFPELIKHKGTIRAIKDGVIQVEVLAESACGKCRAKGACHLAESQVKILDIPIPASDTDKYATGEIIQVLLHPSQGLKAVLFSYVLPLLIFLATLFAVMTASRNELTSGLSALAILIPYYLLLMPLRKHMSKMFVLGIEKI